MAAFLQALMFGLVVAVLYGLIAIGYAVVYSVLRFINFTHGAMASVGVYACWALGEGGLGWPLLPAAALAVVASGAAAAACGGLVLIPANRVSPLTALLVGIGLALVLQSALTLAAGPEAVPFYPTTALGRRLTADMPFTGVHVLALAGGAAVLGLLRIVLAGSSIGLEIRACASSPQAAAVLGLRQRRVFLVAFFISGALAGLAGLLIGLDERIIVPGMGFTVGLRAFIACVAGGITSIRGAALAAALLGVVEQLALYAMLNVPVLAGSSSFVSKDAIALVLLVLALLWRPRGLFVPAGRAASRRGEAEAA